ncbi:MAG TPA: hypothetical protein VL494_24220 [Steroidobacteraceae bacterium]|nr:hypothetical protein [Steroidobacteraceae bacterium]
MQPNPRSSTRPSRGFAERLKEDGRRTIEQRKRSAAERVDGIAQAIERTGAHFSDNEPTLADMANRLASTVSNLATRLREGSIEDLVDDTRALARRNPALFIAGGVLAGFALARFAKASASRAERAASLADDASDDAPTLTEADEVESIVVEQGTNPGGI